MMNGLLLLPVPVDIDLVFWLWKWALCTLKPIPKLRSAGAERTATRSQRLLLSLRGLWEVQGGSRGQGNIWWLRGCRCVINDLCIVIAVIIITSWPLPRTPMSPLSTAEETYFEQEMSACHWRKLCASLVFFSFLSFFWSNHWRALQSMDIDFCLMSRVLAQGLFAAAITGNGSPKRSGFSWSN